MKKTPLTSSKDKTQLERFIKLIKHEITLIIIDNNKQLKNCFEEKDYTNIPKLNCEIDLLKYIRDEIIDRCQKSID